jgi:mannose-6-phosphate isomerase
MSFIRFKPLYKERVWGGRGLASKLGRKDVPGGADDPVGESWEVVDRPEDQSVVRGGPYDGLTLRQLIENHPAEIMGTDWPLHQPFPILVKWLDCRERLSLQVHPPAAVAAELGGEPKTENWYIADSEPGAALLVGLKQGVTRNEFEKALQAGERERLVHRVEVESGDSMFVYSGRLHAIDAGNLILEIQQNSDTTYRVYDWGRMGTDGKPRQLHLEESMKSTDFEDFEPEPIHTGSSEQEALADCPEFRIRKFTLEPDGPRLELLPGEPRLVSVISGTVRELAGDQKLNDHPARGDNLLLPAAEDFVFTALGGPAELLVTDHFGGTR